VAGGAGNVTVGNAAIEGRGAFFADLWLRLRKRKLEPDPCFPLEYVNNVAHYRRRKTRKAKAN